MSIKLDKLVQYLFEHPQYMGSDPSIRFVAWDAATDSRVELVISDITKGGEWIEITLTSPETFQLLKDGMYNDKGYDDGTAE